MGRTSSKNDACRGICVRYLNSKRRKRNEKYYDKWENTRCTICDEYIRWDGIHCPCCSYHLRRRPRGAKAAQILVEQRGMKRI